jgi:hypothetical protein
MKNIFSTVALVSGLALSPSLHAQAQKESPTQDVKNPTQDVKKSVQTILTDDAKIRIEALDGKAGMSPPEKKLASCIETFAPNMYTEYIKRILDEMEIEFKKKKSWDIESARMMCEAIITKVNKEIEEKEEKEYMDFPLSAEFTKRVALFDENHEINAQENQIIRLIQKYAGKLDDSYKSILIGDLQNVFGKNIFPPKVIISVVEGTIADLNRDKRRVFAERAKVRRENKEKKDNEPKGEEKKSEK